MEEDAEFVYLALERCKCTLAGRSLLLPAGRVHARERRGWQQRVLLSQIRSCLQLQQQQ